MTTDWRQNDLQPWERERPLERKPAPGLTPEQAREARRRQSALFPLAPVSDPAPVPLSSPIAAAPRPAAQPPPGRESLYGRLERLTTSEPTPEQLAELRATLPIREPPAAPLLPLVTSDEDLAALNAKASADSVKIDAREARHQTVGRNFSTAGAELPPSAQAAAGRTRHETIWESQVRQHAPPGPVDTRGWERRGRLVARLRRKGDPSEAAIISYVGIVAADVRLSGEGLSRLTYEDFAKKGGWRSLDTVNEIRRFLEAHGLLDVLNVLTRVNGQVRRAANLYLLRGAMAAVVDVIDAVVNAATGAFDRASETLRRYASFFRLPPARWGLPPHYRTNPAPA
jgi:hypothetical protein